MTDALPRTMLTTAESFLHFALAGNATFTLVDREQDRRFTYKVTGKTSQGGSDWIRFVSVLSGSSNDSDYSYMGIITTARSGGYGIALAYRQTAKSRVGKDAPSQKMFAEFWAQVIEYISIPAHIEVWHEGRCGACGRKLTVPESIARGIGPECAGKVGL